MKNQISPAIAGAIVLVVVLIVGLVGYKIFVAKDSSGKPPPEAQKWLHPGSNGMAEHGAVRPGGRPSGGPNPGSAAGMQNHYNQRPPGR